MAAVAGYSWSPSQSPSQSPDGPPTAFPERVIRPLPKRPIRSRLSSEQADSIIYPPVVPSSSPLFDSSYSPNAQISLNQDFVHSDIEHNHPHDQDHVCGCGVDHSDVESDIHGEDYGSVAHRYFEPSSNMQRFPRGVRAGKVSAPKSSASSNGDGYESFENSNNKKKRKIPLSGAGSYASMANSDQTPANGPQKAMFGDDIEGEGVSVEQNAAFYSNRSDLTMPTTSRRRYLKSDQRPYTTRQPLLSSPNSVNTHAGGVFSKAHQIDATSNFSSFAGVSEGAGRISSDPSGNGKENFTFQSPSESSKKMGLVPPNGFPPGPQMNSYSSNQPVSTPLPGQNRAPAAGSQNGLATQAGTGAQPLPHAAQPPAPRPAIEDKEALRRTHNRELRLQARQRRLRAEYEAFHTPPSREDIWICEFCEYESVFGHPPRAFIRRFEETQLKKQKQAENNKRLIEKARKTAKSKKHNKAHPKTAHPASHQQPTQGQVYDPAYDDLADPELDDEGEDLFESSYGDVSPLPSDNTFQSPGVEDFGGGSTRRLSSSQANSQARVPGIG